MAQRYIPGLTARPDDLRAPGEVISAPKNVPPELVEQFQNGSKQPISALMEYCAMQRLTATFKEVPVKNYSMVNKFANECSVEGIAYPQGTGKTKKEAKTRAATIAFSIILGMETFEDYGEELPRQLSNETSGGNVLSNATNSTSYPAPGGLGGEYQAPPTKKDLNKIFHDFLQRKKKHGSVDVVDGPFGYVGKVTISGRVVFEETANTKRGARELVLQTAIENLQMDEELYKTDTWEDIIAKECYKKLGDLISKCNKDIYEAKHSFAAFVINRGRTILKPEVVALATGNTCLSAENVNSDGRTIVDSYAVAMARRALLNYFYKEIKSYCSGTKVMSIFEESQVPGKLQLKEHIQLFLFLNHPPCGDYRDCLDIPCENLTEVQIGQLDHGAHFPAFNDDLPGWFSTKNEDGEIACVEEDQAPEQNLAEIEEAMEMPVMSCSDKLLLWNTVGLQGALFSSVLQPVYIHSIILGQQYHHGHLSRAVCCRLYEIINEYLPFPYQLHHPHVTTVSLHIEEMEGRPTSVSLNWSEQDEKPEIVDGFSGKVPDFSPFRSTKAPGQCASRLCKAAFLHRFRDLGNLMKNHGALQARNYIEAKRFASNYQDAKTVFRNFTHKIGLGHWIRKPKELENFQK